MKAPLPNTFLIGVQKAGTTSLDNWLGQHPDVYRYASLKDIPLFAKFHDEHSLNERLSIEKPGYANEKIILHTAVNYIFYPSLLKKIAEHSPNAKLIIVLRNPVERAISSYLYFHKMMREKRSIEDALIYEPKKDFEITRDNNDFTYIEHGLYYQQIKNCLQYFSKDQLMILDYNELRFNAPALIKKIFLFLNVDENFQPSFAISNVTGNLKSRYLQKKMVQKNSFRKWIIQHLLNPWLPVNKRKIIKNRFFEMNTDRKESPSILSTISKESMQNVTTKLRELYLHDTAMLDELLGSSFYKKWFMHDVIENS